VRPLGTTAGVTMERDIPVWAGQVRNVLREAGPLPLASVARRLPDATTNEVAMAVGWLAHAGEVGFRRREGRWMIDLQRVRAPDATRPEARG
jgi:hypothetical protein